MSVVWMAVVAGLIAFEKTLPWRRVATYGTAAVLLALGVLVLAAPDAVPGLTGSGYRPDGHRDGHHASHGFLAVTVVGGVGGQHCLRGFAHAEELLVDELGEVAERQVEELAGEAQVRPRRALRRMREVEAVPIVAASEAVASPSRK